MDDLPRPDTQPVPGEQLYGLSLHELRERIEVYTSEIKRLETELLKKSAEKSAADAIFGKT